MPPQFLTKNVPKIVKVQFFLLRFGPPLAFTHVGILPLKGLQQGTPPPKISRKSHHFRYFCPSLELQQESIKSIFPGNYKIKPSNGPCHLGAQPGTAQNGAKRVVRGQKLGQGVCLGHGERWRPPKVGGLHRT